MTSEQYWTYGHISRLSDIQSKGPGSSISTGQGITQSQLGVASEAGSRAAADYAQFKQLLSPLITKETALATGDRGAALEAAMPTISQLSGGFQSAKQRIMNSMPPGAARDRALADLQTQTSVGIGGAQAAAVEGAPATLANIGTTVGQFGLQELGAQLSGLSGGASTNFNVGQLQVAQQRSMLDFFGSLAGAAVGAINPLSKLFSGSGGGGGSSAGVQV